MTTQSDAATLPTDPSPGRPVGRARPTSSYTQLSSQVLAAGLLQRRLGWYWTQILVWTAVLAGVCVLFAALGNSWSQLGVAAVLAVVTTQFGFLGHDAAHRQIFASTPCNDWAARLMAGAFAGLSAGWWSHKHNRHHSGPNQEGRDPDIGPGVLAFTPAAVAARSGWAAWFAARQGWAFFPLLTLEGLNLHVASVRELVSRRDLPHRRVELALVAGRLAGLVTAVVVVLPPGKAAAFLAVQLGVFGLLLGGSFAPNHKGMPLVPAEARVDFLRRQVLMSRNIDGGPLTDAAMGGLNYQIEHHLFPSMPRPNLRHAQPLVREHCRQEGVLYTQTSLIGSYGIVVRYLNAVGLSARDPFSCPLVQTLRN
ncbi:acyl-CoA desaturase [Modestobacter sp. NPDC049651]|uniref:fatty acid desaturase family protein n=1 Tax=unclassified Modestobacter TaxID=2643866 RepID=UPI00341097F0